MKVRYLVHIAGGTEVTQFGPFHTEDARREFRLVHGESTDETGQRTPASLPVNEYTWDDSDSDTWLGIDAWGDEIEVEVYSG